MDSSPAKQRTDGKCLRVGIIGTGGIAHGHARGYLAAKGAQLVALCDIDGARLEAFAKQYGVDAPRCYRDYRELLACPDIDAVDICTPNDVHVPVALAAVEAGKAISCEKPVSVDAPTVLRLKDAVAARQLPAAVCFSYRYRQAAIRARELIRSGALGTIRHVYVQYLQSWGNPEKKCPCVWRFKEKASGSGALGDLGIHMIDLVRFLTGEEYIDVIASNGTFVTERRSVDPATPDAMERVDVDDYSHYMTTMTGGIACSFEISRFAFGRGNYQRVCVYGDKGALEYGLEQQDSLLVCFPGDEEKNCRFDRVAVPDTGREQQQSFVDLVLDGVRNDSCASLEDGYIAQLCCDAVKESGRTGRRVSLR